MDHGPDRGGNRETMKGVSPGQGGRTPTPPLPPSLRFTWENLARDWPVWLPLLLAALGTLVVYPRLPEQMAVHWNLAGEPDGWAPRANAASLGLLVAAGIYLLMWWLPAIDPRRDNYARFEGAYRVTRALLVLFLTGLHVMTLLNALGVPVAVDRLVPLGLGALLVGMGNVLGQVRHNYFFGVRTPWTLADEEVWRKTHRLAGRMMVLGGLITVAFSLVGGTWAMTGVLIAVFLAAAVPTVYSYIVWRSGRRNGA